MAASCCDSACGKPTGDESFRRTLRVALAVNAAMFVVEVAAGLAGDSVALQADALDFLGDAANYGISLFVLGLAARWRSVAALIKGVSMGLFGFWVVGGTVYHVLTRTLPDAGLMGGVGGLAFMANAGVALMLYRFRSGDANQRSVWLCSRNDAIGNLAVILAASGVFATGTGWPDVAVAATISILALSGAFQIVRRAARELRARSASALAE
jgi:Co/Zn/Cd efflux system component